MFEKGERVVIPEGGLFRAPGGWSNRRVADNALGTVTSVKSTNIRSVKIDLEFRDGNNWYEGTSVEIGVEYLQPEDPNAPRPRRLGETPEGMLSPLDPRLDWFWVDAADLAKKMDLCSDYDKIAKNLGVPGRPKQFKVVTQVNGFDAEVKVTARSQEEADKMVKGEAA